MDLQDRYPTVEDLRRKARRRVPHFVWEYLDSATGAETCHARNLAGLEQVRFRPAILKGPQAVQLETRFLGVDYDAPFGVAPVGMAGLIWPGAEQHLARAARDARLPFCLSTVATRLPEEIGPIAGDMGWFQLYSPSDPEIRRDILRRAWSSGFRTCVVTVDLPAPSRRERQRKAGITLPPRLTPRILSQIARRPAWALGTLQNGTPRLRLVESYVEEKSAKGSLAHPGYIIRGAPDWDYLHALRSEWSGPLIVKGVMDPADACPLVAAGVDAIWVSNHSGRQFDGARAAIEVLPEVRAAVPDTPLIFDSGVRGGLDILRALALGADFAMLGRAFYYAVAALGARGGAHVIELLRDDMASNLGQMGLPNFKGLRDKLASPGALFPMADPPYGQ
ncbi:alpha-hydroxy acid oxidase [Tropicimonas sp. S265A]|uniref:alpha-hydroxy acid oxidase n=1 Tax=Tropicimonas sp. S265A TaxID=3415134 RepID=UPI003C7BD1A6